MSSAEAASSEHSPASAAAAPAMTTAAIEARKKRAAAAREEEEEDVIVPVGDFFVCRDYATKRYEFGDGISQDIDALAAASTDFDLTGQVVWLVSVLTTWYVAHMRDELRDADVLELGAGAGLCGLLATQWARSVVLSDFEDEVLDLIRRNFKHTKPSCKTSAFNLSWGEEADHARLRTETGLDKFPIILGADIVYWRVSIIPLAKTVSALLARPNGVFVLGYYNRVDSLQRALLDALRDEGLVWTTVDPLSFLPSPPPADLAPFLPNMTIYRVTWPDAPEAIAAAAAGTLASMAAPSPTL